MNTVFFDGSFLFFGNVAAWKITGWGLLMMSALSVFYALCGKRVLSGEITPPISSWMLWLLLDIAATYADLKRGIFNIQLVGYTIGTAFVCLTLLWNPKWMWDKLWDNLTSIAVILAIVVATIFGNTIYGLLVSLVGMTIATIPLLIALSSGSKEKEDVWWLGLITSFTSFLEGNIITSVWVGTITLVIIYTIRKYKPVKPTFEGI